MTFTSMNPHRPADVVATAEETDVGSVDRAVKVAGPAADVWWHQPVAARSAALRGIGDTLRDRLEELAQLTTREIGKPITEARGEVVRAISIFHYYAQMLLGPDGESYPASLPGAWLLVRRFPIGVCGLVTPWNFPVAIPAWKLAPAIAYGNAVLLKPAPPATQTALLLGEIVNAHVPGDLVQVLPGGGPTGEALVGHRGVGAISFTGSAAVGRMVAPAVVSRGGKVQCEMGGQNASLVLADADLDRAVQAISFAAMGYAGQKCTATSRVIVEAPVYDEFRSLLVDAVEAMQVRDPSRDECQVGPLIDEASRDRALRAIAASGGDVLTGGAAMEGDGFYLQPTLVEVRDGEDILAQEEVFAPVTALMRADSADAAVDIANDVRYGLSAAIFTSDLGGTIRLGDRLEAGLVRVNAPTAGVDFHVPFGGLKDSSLGSREQGLAARDFYSETRTIMIAG
ncbi:MAG: aldehyde dehydrogenase family protein [Acidimicrobiales bacterium]